MRIVAGDYKGRRLYMPEGNDVRPTTEKVKEAIFSMLQFDIPGAIFMDVFSGTGSIGLEALSRGAKCCYFCDSSKASLGLIKKNIELCRAQAKSRILPGDYTKTIAGLPEKADIIFLDPPYREGLMPDCFDKIREYDRLEEEGIIVAEHGEREKLPDEMAGYFKIKEKKYGTIVVSIYAEYTPSEA